MKIITDKESAEKLIRRQYFELGVIAYKDLTSEDKKYYLGIAAKRGELKKFASKLMDNYEFWQGSLDNLQKMALSIGGVK